jgi:hypothetical protein
VCWRWLVELTRTHENTVAAALFFGDVRHVASQSYNTGTGSAGNGVRSQPFHPSLDPTTDTSQSCGRAPDPSCPPSTSSPLGSDPGAWLGTASAQRAAAIRPPTLHTLTCSHRKLLLGSRPDYKGFVRYGWRIAGPAGRQMKYACFSSLPVTRINRSSRLCMLSETFLGRYHIAGSSKQQTINTSIK